MWETIMHIPASWLALIGALAGGSGLKFIEYQLNKAKVKDDSAASFRKELREEVTSLRAQLRLVEADVDAWRDRYYKLLEERYRAMKEIDRNNNP